jgi:hypothetical protein
LVRLSGVLALLAGALLSGLAVAADEAGPAGWLQCDPANSDCTSAKPVVLPKAQEKMALTVQPACGDGVPSTEKLLEQIMPNGGQATKPVGAKLATGCETVGDDAGRGKTFGVTCTAPAHRSSCASVCLVADRQPGYDYAYVRLCVQGHQLPSVTLKKMLPTLSPGALQDWCVWNSKSSVATPYAAVTQFRTRLSADGRQFAACATGINWSDSEARTFLVQTLMAKQPVPAPQDSKQAPVYITLAPMAAGSYAAVTKAVQAAAPAVPAPIPAASSGQAAPPPMSDALIIASAMSAAPKEIAQAATIATVGSDGRTRILRQGSNGFTCMPESERAPAAAPMCMDENARQWVDAYRSHGPPPAGRLGLIYRLAGDAGASSTDPYATGPAAGNHWAKAGPHLMIVGADASFYQQYPKSADPRAASPYVMWAGTPYPYLIAPIK